MPTRRIDYSRPPRGRFTLNRDSEFAQGLVHWFPMGPGAPAVAVDPAGAVTLTGANASVDVGFWGEPVTSWNGTSTTMKGGTPLVTAAPLSMMAWVNPSSLSGNRTVISLCKTGGTSRFVLYFAAGLTDLFTCNDAGSFGQAVGATASTGVWQQVFGIEASSSNRNTYLRRAGAAETAGTQDTTSITPTSVNTTALGVDAPNGTNSGFFAGLFGEAAIWNIALSAAQRDALNDPGRRFELWYPLRSRKWMSIAVAGGGATFTSTLIASQAQTASRLAAVQAMKAIAQASATSRFAAIASTRAAIQGAIGSKAIQAQNTKSAAQASTPLVTKAVAAVKSLTQAGVAAVAASRLFLKVVTATQSSVATVASTVVPAGTLIFNWIVHWTRRGRRKR